MRTCLIVCALIALPVNYPAVAQTRTSASYSITTETINGGGARTASANYTNDGSIGGITGISTVAAPAETAKHGYIGQLYDVTGLVVVPAASSAYENATLQLIARQVLDDASLLAVSANSVAWGVVSGPITGISSSGLATAGTVVQDTSATVQGSYQGFTGSTTFTVLLSLTPTTWRQVWYNTAVNSGNAAGTADPYRTGVKNLVVFAHLGPNQNPASAQSSQLPQPQFSQPQQVQASQPQQVQASQFQQAQASGGNLYFSFTQPAGVSGVTYGAEWSATLQNDWQPIPDTGIGTQHIFSVPIGTKPQLFLRLTVSEP